LKRKPIKGNYTLYMVIPCYISKGSIEGILLAFLTERVDLLSTESHSENTKDSLSCLLY